MSFTALILAGARPGRDPVADYAGVSEKPLIEIGGTTMLAHVVHTLRAAGAGRIVVVCADGPVSSHARALGCELLPAQDGPSASAAAALAAIGSPLLLTTADHALLEASWIRDFLARLPAGADAVALLARRETIGRDVAGTKRTYLRLADGDWSGCNLFWLATPRAAGALALWRSVEAQRKRPWAIARRLGPLFLLRFVTGRLTLAQAARRLGRIGGFSAAYVETPFGRAAVDVDKPDDLDLVRALARSAG